MMKNKFAIKEYIKKYGRKSVLLENFAVIFILMFIPFSVICSVTYYNSVQSLKNEEITTKKECIDKIASINDNFFMSINRLSAALLEKENVKLISNIEESRVNLSEKYSEIMNELGMFTLSYRYIETICIYSDLNKHIITPTMSGKLYEHDRMVWIEDYVNTENELFVDSAYFNNKECIVFGRKKTHLPQNTASYAFILIDKDLYIKTLNIRNDGTEEFAVIDKNRDEIIFTSAVAFDRKRENIFTSHSKTFEWNYLYFSDEAYFNLANRKLMQNMMIIFVLLATLCLLITIILSLKTFKPLEVIMEYISPKKPTEEEGENELIYNDLNEMSYITRNILEMIDEKEKLSDELERKMLLLNNANIYALQYQINPHFIFNTLETLKWIILDFENEDDHSTSDIIIKLSKIFKYSLNMSNYLEDFDVEMENTKNYISVLKLRYSEIFDVKWCISEKAYKHKIVKLSLQPLIENAVYHGLKTKEGKGLITVKAEENGENLEITVSDNGVGMSKSELEKLRDKLNSTDVFNGVQVGLSNLNQRIKLICGAKYGIEIESDNGFSVKITLP